MGCRQHPRQAPDSENKRIMVPRNQIRWAGAFFGCQAFLILAWWLVLWAIPAIRTAFFSESFSRELIWVFLAPDLLVITIGSAVFSFQLAQRKQANWLGWFVMGGVVYSSIVTYGLSYFEAATLISNGCMTLMFWSNVFFLRLALQTHSLAGPE